MLRRLLVAACAIFVLAPAWAAQPDLDALWARVESAKNKGELEDVRTALDAVDQEVSRRVATGLMEARGPDTRAARGKVAGLRRWLEPQLPYYRRLAELADRLERESRSVNLWEGSAATLLAYGKLLGELDQAESLAQSFKQAFPGAVDSKPIKKLAAAHHNLGEERHRALVRWAAGAGEALDRAAAADLRYVPVGLYRSRTLLQLLGPGSEQARKVAGRIAELRADAKPVSAFPALELATYKNLVPLLRAAYERLETTASVRRLAVSEDLAGWADPLAEVEHQSVGAFVLVEEDGACRAVHALLDRGRPAGGTWGPWAVRDVDRLGALPCDGSSAPVPPEPAPSAN